MKQMSSSKFLVDLDRVLVADTSFIINLNATTMAANILRAIPHRFVIAETAFQEVENGKRFGHDDAAMLRDLTDKDLIYRADLGELGSNLFERLVQGTASQTLDDGEAATIALAIEISGIAIIDERKARSICSARYPSLELVSSPELFVHECIRKSLGSEAQSQAVFEALRGARMRVPTKLLDKVKEVIGSARADQCHSLPKSARASSLSLS